MEKGAGKNSKPIWMLKALLAAYIVTGVFLLILALLLYKLDLGEQKVTMEMCIRDRCSAESVVPVPFL